MPSRPAAILPVAALALGAFACAPEGPARAGDAPPELAAWTPDAAAFLPVRLRVHPLTRLTKDVAGTPVLALHLELRDGANQVVKCLGVVRAEVVKPEAGAPVQRWEVDLRDPRPNADAFDDVVTRTYALRLGSLPEELVRLADAPANAESAGLRVRARFLFKDAAGEVRQVEGEGMLSGG
jgi:hypothetical protein